LPKSADVLIMAAGRGERLGKRKQFLPLGDSTVVSESVRLFKEFTEIRNIIVVYPPDMEEETVYTEGRLPETVHLVKGSELREDSVSNGLEAVQTEFVLIHDAARPACSKELVKRVMEKTFLSGSAVPAVNPSSTVKIADGKKITPVDRTKVFLVQTPQGFKTAEIKKAYAGRTGKGYTDSSTIAQEAGLEIELVEGERENIKITYFEDYIYVRDYLTREGRRQK